MAEKSKQCKEKWGAGNVIKIRCLPRLATLRVDPRPNDQIAGLLGAQTGSSRDAKQ
jgi:hypothetical protein